MTCRRGRPVQSEDPLGRANSGVHPNEANDHEAANRIIFVLHYVSYTTCQQDHTLHSVKARPANPSGILSVLPTNCYRGLVHFVELYLIKLRYNL